MQVFTKKVRNMRAQVRFGVQGLTIFGVGFIAGILAGGVQQQQSEQERRLFQERQGARQGQQGRARGGRHNVLLDSASTLEEALGITPSVMIAIHEALRATPIRRAPPLVQHYKSRSIFQDCSSHLYKNGHFASSTALYSLDHDPARS